MSDEWDPELPWCVCRQISYGQMIRCDGFLCPFVWFHLPCVHLNNPPKGKWYCNDCKVTMKKAKERSRNQTSRSRTNSASSNSTKNSSYKKLNCNIPSTNKKSTNILKKKQTKADNLERLSSLYVPISEFDELPDERPDDMPIREESINREKLTQKSILFKTPQQIAILEVAFESLKTFLLTKHKVGKHCNGKVTFNGFMHPKYEALSRETGLSYNKIKIWFQNRRAAEWKKHKKRKNFTQISERQSMIDSQDYESYMMPTTSKNCIVSISSEPYYRAKKKGRKSLISKPYYRIQHNQKNVLEATYVKLEKVFKAQNKKFILTDKIAHGLITQTGLTSQQIKSWFYNRRKRDRFAKSSKTAQKPPTEDHLQRDDEHIYIIHDGFDENNLDETHDYSHFQENLLSTETIAEISVQDNPNHKVADEDSDSDIEILSETIRSSQDPSNSTASQLPTPNIMLPNFAYDNPFQAQTQYPTSSQNYNPLPGPSYQTHPYTPTSLPELSQFRNIQNLNTADIMILPSFSPLTQQPIMGSHQNLPNPQVDQQGPPINVGGKLFNVRKEFLASISKYFNALYIIQERHHLPVIEVPNVDANEFDQFLCVVFPDGYPITKDNVACLLKLAKHFDVPMLVERCQQFLNDCPDNNVSIMEKLRLANSYDLTHVLDKCISIMTIKTYKKIKSDYDHQQLNDYTKARLYEHLVNLI